MATASNLFKTRKQLENLGATQIAANYIYEQQVYVPLYEGKMFWLYNHHFGEFPDDTPTHKHPDSIPKTDIAILKDTNSSLSPWYWINRDFVKEKMIKTDSKGNVLWEWTHNFYIAFRDVTNATNERTCIASLMPSAVGAGIRPRSFSLREALSPAVRFSHCYLRLFLTTLQGKSWWQ